MRANGFCQAIKRRGRGQDAAVGKDGGPLASLPFKRLDEADDLLTQFWFRSSGQCLFKLVTPSVSPLRVSESICGCWQLPSLDELCDYLCTVSASLAKAAYKPADNQLTLAKGGKTMVLPSFVPF